MVYATGIHPKWETPNDGYGGKCHYNAEWRGALDSANANLKKENAELKADRDSYKKEMERLGDRVIETQDFGLAEIKKLKDKLFNITQILANENGYAKKLLEDRNKLKAENENLSKQNQRLIKENDDLQDRFDSLDGTSNGLMSRCARKDKEIAILKDERENFEKNFDCLVGKLNTEIAELKDENSFLNDKVDSLHRVVDNRDRFIHKIQDENSNLHNTIDALERKCEAWGVGETSETVMMTKANYKKLRDKITELEKEKANAFRVLNLRDERIKQLETRELELAEKVDGRNLPPQDSVADNVGQLFDIGPKGKPADRGKEIADMKYSIQRIEAKLATIEDGATR